MDLPVFHLDFLNNRALIGIIAVLHVVINHGMAVGGIPLVAYLEYRGYRTGSRTWDDLAHRILTFFFLVTIRIVHLPKRLRERVSQGLSPKG